MTPDVQKKYEHLRDELMWLLRMRWVAVAAMVGGAAGAWQFAAPPSLAVRLAWLAVAVSGYNLLLWINERPGAKLQAVMPLVCFAALQILLDFVALALLSAWTGGINSPLVWLFALHMVIASLLLRPILAYAAIGAALALELGALEWSHQWPATGDETYLAFTWIALMVVMVATVNHITGKLRRERLEVHRESERHNAILQTAADGIITIDSTGRVLSANPAAEHIFDYRDDEIIGRNVSMLMPEPDHSRHDEYLARYLETGHAKIIGIGREVVGKRKSGEEFPLDLAVSEVRLDEGVFFTGIVRDITERKAAEAELAHLYEELKRHQDAIIQQEKMAAIGQMAAGVAHEISNPLAGMNSLIQLLRRHPDRLDDKTLGQFDDLVNRVVKIVRQLTQFSHPLDYGWETVSVNELVRSAFDLLRFDHRLRKVDVQMKLSPTDIQARWMPQAIHQVLVNLIGNALDAMDDVDQRRLIVATAANDGVCTIEVADSGHGITSENLKKLFDPFFTTKPVGRGTGLGLSISYNLVNSHGGHIDVESHIGKGTRFSVVLPLSCDRETAPRAFPKTGRNGG